MDRGGFAIGSPIAADVLYGRDAFGFELMQFPPGGEPAPGAVPIWENESLVEDYARIVRRGDVLRYQGWCKSKTVSVLNTASFR